MIARTFTAIVALLVLAACGCNDPFAVEGARVATAREAEVALEAYAETATCISLPDESRRVTWRIADRLALGDERIGGARRGDTLYLTYAGHDLIRLRRIARHESMHHILWRATGDGDSDHQLENWSVCAPGRR